MFKSILCLFVACSITCGQDLASLLSSGQQLVQGAQLIQLLQSGGQGFGQLLGQGGQQGGLAGFSQLLGGQGQGGFGGLVNPGVTSQGFGQGLGLGPGQYSETCKTDIQTLESRFIQQVPFGQLYAPQIFQKLRDCEYNAQKTYNERTQEYIMNVFKTGQLNINGAATNACMQALQTEERECQNLRQAVCDVSNGQAFNLQGIMRLVQNLNQSNQAKQTCQGVGQTVTNPGNLGGFIQNRGNAGIGGATLANLGNLFGGR